MALAPDQITLNDGYEFRKELRQCKHIQQNPTYISGWVKQGIRNVTNTGASWKLTSHGVNSHQDATDANTEWRNIFDVLTEGRYPWVYVHDQTELFRDEKVYRDHFGSL